MANTAFDNLVLGLNPFGYWPLNESTGAVANDLTSGAHNGSYLGTAGADYNLGQTPGPITGDSTGAYQGLNTTTSHGAQLPTPGVTSGGWSVGGWWKIPTLPSTAYYALWGYSSTMRLLVGSTGKTLFQGNGSYTSTNAITAGGYHHIVLVYDPTVGTYGTYYLYVDGALDSSYALPSASGQTFNPTQWYVGQYDTSVNYKLVGYAGHIAFYPTALSAATIQNVYNAGKNGPPTASVSSLSMMTGGASQAVTISGGTTPYNSTVADTNSAAATGALGGTTSPATLTVTPGSTSGSATLTVTDAAGMQVSIAVTVGQGFWPVTLLTGGSSGKVQRFQAGGSILHGSTLPNSFNGSYLAAAGTPANHLVCPGPINWEKTGIQHDLSKGPLTFELVGKLTAQATEFSVAFLCSTTGTTQDLPALSGNGYVARWVGNGSAGYLQIYKCASGTYTQKAQLAVSGSPDLSVGGDHKLIVTAVKLGSNTQISVQIDGSQWLTYVDSSSPYTSGYYGVRQTYGTSNPTYLRSFTASQGTSVGYHGASTPFLYNLPNMTAWRSNMKLWIRWTSGSSTAKYWIDDSSGNGVAPTIWNPDGTSLTNVPALGGTSYAANTNGIGMTGLSTSGTASVYFCVYYLPYDTSGISSTGWHVTYQSTAFTINSAALAQAYADGGYMAFFATTGASASFGAGTQGGSGGAVGGGGHTLM